MNSHIQSLVAIALFVLFLGVTPMVEASCSTGPCLLVWSDEFNGPSVDPAKWEFENGNGCKFPGDGLCGWGNQEKQYYQPGNASVAGGLLTITAEPGSNTVHGYSTQYTSSKLRTKGLHEWTYGRFEMRAKLPTGQGMWPAFWMLPTNSPYGSWARSGEIDIMEMVGNDPDRIYGTIHYHDNWPDNWSHGGDTLLTPSGTAHDVFHTYAVEWEADEIRWYVDDVQYYSTNWWDSVGNPWPAPFDVDFHLILNLAVGGQWPGDPDGSTNFPQEFVIDYVRVYSLDEQPTTLVFDDMEHADPFFSGWFAENGAPGGGVGGGSIGPNSTDLPPEDAGSHSLQTSWASGGTPGYFGVFGRYHPTSIAENMTVFRMWINPDAGQDYTLGIKLKEDDDGDGDADDEFAFDCVIAPGGPCANAGGGWQLVSIPFADFADDNTYLPGGDGIFNPLSLANGGNGELKEIVMTVHSNSGANVSFRTDYWNFHAQLADADSDGVSDGLDNCTNVANPNQVDADNDGHGNFCDADYNNDCVVNAPDLALLKAGYITTDPVLDLNSDGVVNSGDLSIFKGLYFGAPGASAPGAQCN